MQKLKFFHRAPNAIQSGGERNLIGRRTESDRTADANGGKMLRVMAQRARRDGLSVGGYGISFTISSSFGTSLTSKKAQLPCGNCAYMHIGSCCLLQEADGELTSALIKPPGC
jgi:hypothetical protein